MLSHLRFLGQRCANVARTSSISLLQRPSFTTHLTIMKPVPQLLSISRPTSLLITGTKRATPLHRCFSQKAQGYKLEDKEDREQRYQFAKKMSRCRDRKQLEKMGKQLSPFRTIAECSFVLDGLINTGQHQRALAFPERMKKQYNIQPNVVIYNKLITMCEKGGRWERALELFEEVKKHPRMEPDIRTYSATISACEKGGQWERALELFEEVKKHPRMEPNIRTYSATISACEKGGRWERALELLEEVKKHPRMEPNIRTYSATISACEKGGQWERAWELFEEVKKHPRMEPNIITYNAILDALSTTEPSHARVLYLEAVSKGFFNTQNERRENGMPKLDLHDHSEGAAETATRWWLEEQVPSMKENKQLIIETGWGKTRPMWQTSDINDRVRNVLHDMEVQILPQDNPGHLLIQYR